MGKKNPDFDTSFITTYAGNFGTPALVIFAITAGGVTFELFSEYFGYAIILLTLFGIVGLIFLVLMKKDLFVNYQLLSYQILEIWVFRFVYLPMVN